MLAGQVGRAQGIIAVGLTVPGGGPAEVVRFKNQVIEGQMLPGVAMGAGDVPATLGRRLKSGVDAVAWVGGGGDQAHFGHGAVPQPFAGDFGGAGVDLVQFIQAEDVGRDGFELAGLPFPVAFAIGMDPAAAQVEKTVPDAFEGNFVGAPLGAVGVVIDDQVTEIGAGLDGRAKAGLRKVRHISVCGHHIQGGQLTLVAAVQDVGDEPLAEAHLARFDHDNFLAGIGVDAGQVQMLCQIKQGFGVETAAVEQGPGQEIKGRRLILRLGQAAAGQ